MPMVFGLTLTFTLPTFIFFLYFFSGLRVTFRAVLLNLFDVAAHFSPRL